MAATNFTPIQLYFSTTASAAPTAANLAQGELAINITDGKLYYEDNAGAVQVIATKGAGTIGGSTTQIQYNNAGALAGNAAMVFNNSTNVTTLTTLNLTNALGAIYGGTAQSAYTQGDFVYASATNTLSKLGIGANTYILTSTGSVPQWVAPSSIAVLTATNLAGGLAGSVPYQSALDTTTFLAIGAANRVMTSSGTAPQWVTALTGLTGVSSSSITNTSLTSGRLVYSSTAGLETDSANLTFNGTTLTANTIGAFTLGGTVSGGGNQINNVVIGTTTPLAGAFTTLTASSTLSVTGAGSIEGLTVGRGAGGVASNTAFGLDPLFSNTTGGFNAAVGRYALYGNTTGANNTAFGRSLVSNTTGNHNVAVGLALYSNTTASDNTAVGYESLYSNTTASNNTAVGYQAAYSGVTATEVVAIGKGALYANTVNYGTAVGFHALNANTTGAANAAFGAYALSTNTTGAGNSAFGALGFGLSDSALQANTTGSYNSAFGLGALASNTTASNNTAVGYQAGYSTATGDDNTFLGYQAGYNTTGAGASVYVGEKAGYSVTTGGAGFGNQTFVGYYAGLSVTGYYNTFIGASAGRFVTTGNRNTILGGYDGNTGGLDIRTASNYIVLSDGDGNPLISTANAQTVALQGAVPNSGTGITFPATQSASSNANTLDDYEEGTWTPVANNLTVVGTVSYVATYTKIGRVVYINLRVNATTSSTSTSNSTYFDGLPFDPAINSTVTAVNEGNVASLGVGLFANGARLFAPSWTAVQNATLSGFYYV